ncbi:MAG: Wzz/FepE/Etk N-terminal domain-containing protein [Pseudomonadota bacterium]
MAAISNAIDIRKYLFILKRNWVLSSATFLTALTIGVLYCLLWPPMYQASCLVLVQSQKVPTNLVQALVTTQIQERLQIITQQVLSRTRLTEVIERFNLYPKVRDKMTPDQLAQYMRKDVSISISRQNHFTISFLYPEPQTVAAVTNALAAFYVDSNLRLREEDAVGTARFLTREMERIRNQLREWEAKITEFKEKHLHELPEDKDKNIQLLDQLQKNESSIQFLIQTELGRMQSAEAEMGKINTSIQGLAIQRAQVKKGGANVGQGDEDEEKSVKGLRKRIDELRLRYTDRHPDIQRREKMLEYLEKVETAKEQERQALIAAGKEVPKPDEDAFDLQVSGLKEAITRQAQIIEVAKKRVDEFHERLQSVRDEMSLTQRRIENGPEVGEKLSELTRGYETLKGAYEKLQGKSLDANLAANLERTQRGEQFEVVDPAEVPEEPYLPNVKKAVPAAFGLGLVLALGLAFALDFIDNSFTSVEQTERLSRFPVLVVIPRLDTDSERAWRRRRLTLAVAIFGGWFLIQLALVALLATGRAQAIKQLVMKYIQQQ